jgi:mannose-6-phosphate isomerase-like protein (cupin superfamily)
VVVAGSGELSCGDHRIVALPGTSLFVPLGAIHRASAGADGLLIIEVQRGDQLREDDIERFEDDFGRVVS